MKDIILQGDVLEKLKELSDESVDCIVTSPPYWGLRDYGVEGQIGLEPTLNEYLDRMLLITAELKRVLKKTGTLWWNHGDNYGGSGKGGGNKQIEASKAKGNIGDTPDKCLALQAYRLAIRMTDEQGWILRNVCIWHKPNVMPSSVKDRFTVDYEPIFFFSKNKKYWFEQQFEDRVTTNKWNKTFNMRVRDVKRGKVASAQYKATKSEIESANKYGISGSKLKGHSGDYDKEGNFIGIPGKRGMRSVWKIATKPFKEAHFATFPELLIETPIKAGCPPGGVVLDPFMGACTTALVAKKLGRHFIGIELNPEYIKICENRLKTLQPTLI